MLRKPLATKNPQHKSRGKSFLGGERTERYFYHRGRASNLNHDAKV
nr:MAG TPA: hypothetical protein [Caudoviricetes sp.]DAX71563.1 MAG TPA: hypothetical protein [Caudoviricetes sp.]